MNTVSSYPATAIQYTPLVIPTSGELTESKLNEVIVSTQGEAVEIMDTREVIPAMKVFHSLYLFSSECVYRTLKNNRYLLFDHQAIPVIRDGDIIHYWIEQKNSLDVIPHISVDVEALWQETSGEEYDRTKELLQLLQQFSRAQEVTLIGSAPTLVFLFVQEYFSGPCKSFYYQKAKNAEKIKIY